MAKVITRLGNLLQHMVVTIPFLGLLFRIKPVDDDDNGKIDRVELEVTVNQTPGDRNHETK